MTRQEIKQAISAQFMLPKSNRHRDVEKKKRQAWRDKRTEFRDYNEIYRLYGLLNSARWSNGNSPGS